MYHKNAKAYKRDNLEAELSVADPHRIIQLLMQGVLERLARAKGAMARRDFETKGDAISGCMAILNSLQDSLDLSQGKIAEDLYALYGYMKDKLREASLKLDPDMIDEVANLMITIKSGWDAIPDSEKQKGYQLREQLGELK